MRIHGQPFRTIWPVDASGDIAVIDQTLLPFAFEVRTLRCVDEAAAAIRDMVVRGAPLIGVTAAYGVALAVRKNSSDASLAAAAAALVATRPTAINLRWAVARMQRVLGPLPQGERAARAYAEADAIAEEDIACCAAIGQHGLGLLRGLASGPGMASRWERADPLQRGLARLRRLGHGTRAGVRRARSWPARARLRR